MCGGDAALCQIILTTYLILGPNHMFGTGKARHFKFGVHIDIVE